jgi:tetratricopeptide (TPR) repeat protein
MACNTSLMNSWHTFSPNGRWMVFSSKSRSPYTQLFITHLDENGADTPPLLIPNSTADNRAANIPEFVAIKTTDLLDIKITGMEYQRATNHAIELYYDGKLTDAVALLKETLASSPDDKRIRADILDQLGEAYFVNGSFDEAIGYFEEAARIYPECTAAFISHGQLSEKLGRLGEAVGFYTKALDIDPKNTNALFYLAAIRRTSTDPALRNIHESIALLTTACKIASYKDPGLMTALAQSYAAAGDDTSALKKASFALELAQRQGVPGLVATNEQLIEKLSAGKR